MPAITITSGPLLPSSIATQLTSRTLSDPVSIVHIPVDRSEDYATRLYWTIDTAATNSGEFFNVTSNQVEVSLSFRSNGGLIIDRDLCFCCFDRVRVDL